MLANLNGPRRRAGSASYCSPVHSNPTGGWFKGNFSAALLAGGRSILIGRDKAEIAVEWRDETIPLPVPQLRTLLSLESEALVYSGCMPGYHIRGADRTLDPLADA